MEANSRSFNAPGRRIQWQDQQHARTPDAKPSFCNPA